MSNITEVSRPTQWKPGQSGNLNGRPVGTRQAFSAGFLRDLAECVPAHHIRTGSTRKVAGKAPAAPKREAASGHALIHKHHAGLAHLHFQPAKISLFEHRGDGGPSTSMVRLTRICGAIGLNAFAEPQVCCAGPPGIARWPKQSGSPVPILVRFRHFHPSALQR